MTYPAHQEAARKQREQTYRYLIRRAAEGGCCPSNSAVAHALGCADSTACIRIRELENEGRLKRSRVGNERVITMDTSAVLRAPEQRKAANWTDDEKNRLFEMRAAGKTFHEIGKELSRTDSGCQLMYNRHLRHLAQGEPAVKGRRPSAEIYEIFRNGPQAPKDGWPGYELEHRHVWKGNRRETVMVKRAVR